MSPLTLILILQVKYIQWYFYLCMPVSITLWSSKKIPKDIWCGIWFILTIIHVVNCIIIWKCRTHAFRLIGINLLPHMELLRVLLLLVLFFLLFPLVVFMDSKLNTNLGQPTPHRLYLHMTSKHTKQIHCWGLLDF